MKVVIVCCVRNEEYVVGELLQSLVDQSIVPDKILLVNDGSVDGTKGVLRFWKFKYPDKIVIINRDERIGGPNLGDSYEMASVFNVAFEFIEAYKVEYDYLMICGADDVYPKKYIEDMVEFMEQDELVVVASGRIDSRLVYSRKNPSGAGRMIKRQWWLEYGQRYKYPSDYWETGFLMVAKMKGYKTVVYPKVVFSTRIQGEHGSYGYGVMHRRMGYKVLSVMKYFGLLVVRFKWRGAYRYFKGYCKKPEEVILEDRKLSEDWNHWLKSKK